jgi:hypothetical protein
MKTHELRILPRFFRAILAGDKTFEVRKDDRGFRRYDTLILKEWDDKTLKYTGKAVKAEVSYILYLNEYRINPEYVVMGFKGFDVLPESMPDRPALTSEGVSPTAGVSPEGIA